MPESTERAAPRLANRQLARKPSRRAAIAALALALLAAAPAQAKTYGLVIGIDDYRHVTSLAGAVNDARDLARALQAGGAEVTLLLDAAATRARIMESWSAIATTVRPGDSVVLTYAGHGVQMPEALPGDETDGMDEVFILAGFQVQGPGLAERIRDNDIAAMLGQIPREVPVLLVADSCHSGTMTRSIDPRGALGRSRYVAIGPVTGADPLPPPAPATRSLDPADFANVVFAHAARDEEQTPEVEIDGAYRGALSWSVARALEQGRARGETLAGFRDFVVEQVRALSGARQTPGVRFPRALDAAAATQTLAALLDGPGTSTVTPAATDPVSPGADPLASAPPPRLFVRGSTGAGDALAGAAEIAQTEETARLLWDTAQGELIDRATADVIAEVSDAAAVADAVAKWRAVQALLRWAPQRPLDLRIEPDDRRYRLGDLLWITAAQPAPREAGFRYLTIVNLASTGEVQAIFPSPAHVAQNLDAFAPGEAERRLGPAPVTLPVGADHVLAIASRARPEALRAEIARLDGRRAPQALLDALAAHAADPASVRVGVAPIFTSR